jgi:hypothetical protein
VLNIILDRAELPEILVSAALLLDAFKYCPIDKANPIACTEWSISGAFICRLNSLPEDNKGVPGKVRDVPWAVLMSKDRNDYDNRFC